MADQLRIEVLLQAIDKATKPFRDIANGASAAAEAVRKSRAALKTLEGTDASVTKFRAMRVELRGMGPALEQLKAKSSAAAAKLEAQKIAHQKLTGELKAERLAVQASAKAVFASGQASAKDVIALRAREMALARLETRYTQSTAALAKVRNASRLAEGDVGRHAKKQTELAARLDATRRKLEAAGLSTDKLGARQRELRGEIEKANAAIDRIELDPVSFDATLHYRVAHGMREFPGCNPQSGVRVASPRGFEPRSLP